MYTTHKHELMSNPEFKGASLYDGTTYGTWDISMKKIEKTAEGDNSKEALAAQSACISGSCQYSIRIVQECCRELHEKECP